MNTDLFFQQFKGFFTRDPRQIDWRRTLILVLCLLLVASVLWHKLMPEIRTIDTTTFKRVPEIHEVKTVQRVLVPCPQQGIQVLDKEQATAKLGPGWQQGILSDAPAAVPTSPTGPTSLTGPTLTPDLQLTATAEVPPTDNGAQALSVIDMDTGKSTIVVRDNPAPWFQFRNDGALGVRYGINEHLQPIGTVYGRWDFLRVKDLYFSANGTMETDGDAALQFGAEYRW